MACLIIKFNKNCLAADAVNRSPIFEGILGIPPRGNCVHLRFLSNN